MNIVYCVNSGKKKKGDDGRITSMKEVSLPIIRRTSVRSRRLWLTVRLDGSIVLTVPRGMRESVVAQFVRAQMTWVKQQLTRVRRYKDDVFLPRGRRDYLARKEEARALVREIITAFAARHTFQIRKIFIKNLRRNWGSCSTLGNLNFNYKIVLLPRRLAEYVVFHELCHLEAFDHSKKFWSLVAREFPDHKTLRKELRTFHL